MVIKATMGAIAKATIKTGKFAVKTNNVVDKGIMRVISKNPIARGVDKSINYVGAKTAKGLGKLAIETNAKKTNTNLWTGIEAGAGLKIAAGLGAVGVIGASIGNQQHAPYDKTNQTEYVGMPKMMDADGVGNDANVAQKRYNKMKANNLNADGSLVFGLHNNR